ncbi:MAG: tetratricopeptide repeat protein [Thermoleophilia bacterium]|nr:tetratricopeptide repeat protein [Thermoleophilia bacterium]
MSDNLKWLLLIPVVIVAISLGYVIPKLVGSDDERPEQRQSQALQLDIDATGERIENYRALLESNPEDVELLRGLADSHREIGSLQAENRQYQESFTSFKTAVDYYREYLAKKPEAQDAGIDLGLTYFYMEMPLVAERELQKVVQSLPQSQRAWHSLGWLQMRLGKDDEARASWQKSYELDPESAVGRESRAFMDELDLSRGVSQNEIQVPPAP